MSSRFWGMLSQKIGFFFFSKQTPNRWPLYSCASVEWEKARLREFVWGELKGWSPSRDSPSLSEQC